MKYLLIQQKDNDRVFFYSDESTEKTTLKYQKFIQYIAEFTIQDRLEFLETLNRFHIILLNIQDGSWEVKVKLNDCSIKTFEDMIKSPTVFITSTNNDYLESTDYKTKSLFEMTVENSKKFIDNINKRNKDNAAVYLRRKR